MYILWARRTNDNRLATRHIRHEANLRPLVPHLSVPGTLRATVLVAALGLSASRVRAQAATSLQSDATVLQRHGFGIRLLTSFARWDNQLGDGGTRNILSGLNVDSLTPSEISSLAASQTSIRTLTGNPAFRVTAGNFQAAGDARVVTAPLILEYGLTNRLSLGVVIPLVETRTTLYAQANRVAGVANVGANPALTTSDWSQNASIVTSLRAAAATLSARLATCQAAPNGAGCSTLLTQQSTAQALIAQTAPFAAAIEALYGTSAASPGAAFVPINTTATQTTINSQLGNLRAQYLALGGTVAAGSPAGANGPLAHDDVNALLARAGYDSLASTTRSSIGDITVGATYQLMNSFADPNASTNYRVAVNAGYRLGTGEPANRNRLFDNATGYGQPGVIVGGAADVQLRRRVFLSAVGSYTKQLGSVDVSRVANAANAPLPLTAQSAATFSAGDEIMLTAIPRYRLGGLFTVDGIYSLRHVAAESYTATIASGFPGEFGGPVGIPGLASSTAHQLGFGFSYSSALSDRNPGRFPYEASVRHLETLAATGGPVPKTYVDQIQLRVFFR